LEAMGGFMTIFYIGVGIYAIYAAIAGKGYLYKNDYPEEMKEEANKMMRVVAAIAGPVLIAFAVLEYFQVGGYWTIIAEMVIIVALLTTYTIIFRRKFGKILKKNKRMP